jgi:hypothetical protein
MSELLARVTGGSVWRDPLMPRGGMPTLTQEEIKGALGGLAAGPYRLALLMWCLDGSVLPALERAVLVELTKWVRYHRQRPPRGLLRAFARVAILEVTVEAICQHCRGVGYREAKTCKPCEGTGRRRFGGRRKAEIASVHWDCGSRGKWDRHADEYGYEDVHDLVLRWRDDAARHIRRQLRRG